MRFYPESKFAKSIEVDIDSAIPYLTEKLVGKKSFEIETLFGMKEASYDGKFEDNQIYFTRSMDSWNGIPIYPTSKIKFISDLNNTVINIKCSISAPWVIFIYLIYFFLILFFFIGWFNATSIRSKTVLFFEIIGSVTLINTLLFSCHFSELKNVKKIINEVVINYGVKVSS